MGDVVAADRTFMDVHLQNTNYLSSRECKLAEDLIRAIKTYDYEALEECQKDRTASGLDRNVCNLVQTLRVAGMAKKKKKESVTEQQAASKKSNAPPHPVRGGAELERKPKAPIVEEEPKELEGEELAKALAANYNELDDIMNGMGLNDSDRDDTSSEGKVKEEDLDDDDDDIDLR